MTHEHIGRKSLFSGKKRIASSDSSINIFLGEDLSPYSLTLCHTAMPCGVTQDVTGSLLLLLLLLLVAVASAFIHSTLVSFPLSPSSHARPFVRSFFASFVSSSRSERVFICMRRWTCKKEAFTEAGGSRENTEAGAKYKSRKLERRSCGFRLCMNLCVCEGKKFRRRRRWTQNAAEEKDEW